jgi:hypothetical protein
VLKFYAFMVCSGLLLYIVPVYEDCFPYSAKTGTEQRAHRDNPDDDGAYVEACAT